MKKNIYKVCIALWMLLLVALGSYYLFLAPRESEYSEAENRTLSGFPEVTAESVFSGRFGEEFETWLLDRFPARDSVITAINQLKSTASFATYEEYLLIAEDVTDNLSQGDYQEALDAILADLNSATEPPETTVPATEPPETQPDTEPAETKPVEDPPIVEKPEASAEDYPQNPGIFMDTGNGEQAAKSYSRNAVVAATAVLNKYAALLPENGKLMFTIGPPAYMVNQFVNAEEKVSFYSTWDEVINGLGSDNVYAFDSCEILGEGVKQGHYMSFRTDNHWTPHGAYLIYSQMAAQAGKELCSYPDDFTVTVEENFRGTYYRDNPSAYASAEPDTLELLMPKIGVEYRKITGPDTYQVVDFLKMDANRKDRYTVYLGGPSGPWHYVECDNEETENCLVVTDSFGLTVIPFLTYNYKQVHYYDARYFNQSTVGGSVSEMIEKYNIQDIYVIVAEFNSFKSNFLLGTVNYHLYMK